jgi:hypothetical protein
MHYTAIHESDPTLYLCVPESARNHESHSHQRKSHSFCPRHLPAPSIICCIANNDAAEQDRRPPVRSLAHGTVLTATSQHQRSAGVYRSPSGQDTDPRQQASIPHQLPVGFFRAAVACSPLELSAACFQLASSVFLSYKSINGTFSRLFSA